MELDLYGKAVAALREDEEQVQQAQRQQVERLRYQARLAERQYNQTDPDNRLVAAELERRWEAALRDLKDAEERLRHEQQQPRAPEGLGPEERDAFLRAGETIPELWRQDRLSPQQKKAFLRSLIDKVVVHRSAPDTLHVRIVWRGGDTTTTSLAGDGGVPEPGCPRPRRWRRRSSISLDQGKTDEEIAALLTRRGYRSPKHATVLPSTVRILRLRHRLLRDRSQSHPRRIPGSLTVSQVARSLGIPSHWIYDRIHNGTIKVAIDSARRLYLFPDQPKTITLFKQLRAGKLQELRF